MIYILEYTICKKWGRSNIFDGFVYTIYKYLVIRLDLVTCRGKKGSISAQKALHVFLYTAFQCYFQYSRIKKRCADPFFEISAVIFKRNQKIFYYGVPFVPFLAKPMTGGVLRATGSYKSSLV